MEELIKDIVAIHNAINSVREDIARDHVMKRDPTENQAQLVELGHLLDKNLGDLAKIHGA